MSYLGIPIIYSGTKYTSIDCDFSDAVLIFW